jgi:hypothetical protein
MQNNLRHSDSFFGCKITKKIPHTQDLCKNNRALAAKKYDCCIGLVASEDEDLTVMAYN